MYRFEVWFNQLFASGTPSDCTSVLQTYVATASMDTCAWADEVPAGL